MSRRELERACASGRIHAADVRAFVVTWRRTARERARLVHLILRKVSIFGSGRVS